MTAILLTQSEHQEMVCALNNAEDALMNCQALLAALKRVGFSETCYGTNAIALEFVGPALTMLRAKVPQTYCRTYSKEETDAEVAAGTLVRTGPFEWTRTP